MKYPALLATLLSALCAEHASAQVLIYNVFGTPTTGNIVFNDTASVDVSGEHSQRRLY